LNPDTALKQEPKNMPHLYIFLGLLFLGLLASCFM
jgi:hypothetical protein